jgi:polysaccharide biosynthesis transport protein
MERFASLFAGSDLAQAAPHKQLRLLVFTVAFVVLAGAGLIYDYSRTAEYRTGARLEIIPAERLSNEPSASVVVNNSSESSAFLTEVQLLTARTALEEVVARLRRAGLSVSPDGQNPVLALQSMISTQPIAGTQVLELWAVGEKPEILPFALNQLIEIYQNQLSARFVDSSSEALEQARAEKAKYQSAILQGRGELELFRVKFGIVSQEREENELTARARGLNNALNAAEEKTIAAQTKLRSLRAAIAAGKAVTRAKDNPTLAGMEQRLSLAREELKQLQSRYTAAYLVREPQAAELRTKIPELEEQIRRERAASQQANLADAEQEAAQTQEARDRIRGELSSEKRSLQSFSARLSEYNALQAQLQSLEKLHDGVAERLVKLEARESARRPKVQVIQSATLPSAPWKPNYHRDAAIVIAASLLLAWLAAWLADFLTRREAGPSVIVAPTTLAYPINMPEMIQQQPMPILGPSVPTAQLPAPHDLPRELDGAELSAMLEAADEDTRLALGALLCGVSPEELIGLTWNDIDLDVGTIKILHPAARSIAIGAEFNSVLRKTKQQKSGQESDTLLGTTGGAPSLSHVEALISYAAHDAGLAQPAQITPWSVRHTYISYLVRQGIRFSELARIVGTIPAEVTAAYGASLPATARRSLDQIDPVIPALRAFARDFAQTYGPA